MFFLVSGAAASGKTSVARVLAAQQTDLVAHDHDEKQAGDANMRCLHLEEWVQLALEHQSAGRDFLLTSHSPLGELLACPSAPALADISACLLDCHDNVRIQRMRARGVDPRWPPSQHVLNWASWHRMHAWDPQWEQSVIVGNGSAEHDYGRWTNWQQADARWRVYVLDSSHIDKDQTLRHLAEWMQAEKQKMPPLSHATRWWE